MEEMLLKNRRHKAGVGAVVFFVVISLALATLAACVGPPSGDEGGDEASTASGERITVSIEIDCLTLFEHDPELAEQVSDDGVVLAETDVEIAGGGSVSDAIKASGVAFVGDTYISSIGGLSEMDAGAQSGWVYSVNGEFPIVGVTAYEMKDGDAVRFRYTLDGGLDVKP
ncbi:MAG: DUF4430 domain-containing protein [Clostridiales Family XIII bacterium]|jgi:hypothetical protein|nr:DUF4430 domain-containing protein [Clostridiales Family XIII bacterium]